MSNISSLGGGNSPSHERVSLSFDKIQLKRKRLIETSSEEGIESDSKKKKICDVPVLLEEARKNIKEILPLLNQKNISDEEKEIYNDNVKLLLQYSLKYNNEYINSTLAVLPKLSTKPIENILRYQNLYRNVSCPFTRELIKIYGGKSIAKNLEVIEESGDYKKDTHKQIDYDSVKDIITLSPNSSLLMFLLEYANPDIRKAILGKDKFFEKDEDNNTFIKDFIEKYKDNPVILSGILNNRALSSNLEESDILLHNIIDNNFDIIKKDSQNLKSKNLDLLVSLAMRDMSLVNKKDDFLEKLIHIGKEIDKTFNDPDLLIILGLYHEVYDCEDFRDSLINVAQRPQLSLDDAEHSQRLTALIDLGKKIDEKFENPDLLIALGLNHEVYNREDFRDSLINVAQRPQLSLDDAEHHNRLMALIDLGKEIDEKFENPDLLIALGLYHEVYDCEDFRDSLINIVQRPRLSLDDTEHSQRLMALIDLGRKIFDRHFDPELMLNITRNHITSELHNDNNVY